MTARRSAISMLASAASLCLVAMGCGGPGSESGDGESRVLGQSGDTELGMLEQDELQELCDEAQSYADAQLTQAQLRELACGHAALQALAEAPEDASDDELRELCAQTHQGCMFAVEPAPILTVACGPEAEACSSTVSDFEDCVTRVALQAAQTLAALPSCDAISAEGLAELGAVVLPPEPTECESLRADCPGLLGGPVPTGGGGAGGAGGAAGAEVTAPAAGAGGSLVGGAGGMGGA